MNTWSHHPQNITEVTRCTYIWNYYSYKTICLWKYALNANKTADWCLSQGPPGPHTSFQYPLTQKYVHMHLCLQTPLNVSPHIMCIWIIKKYIISTTIIYRITPATWINVFHRLTAQYVYMSSFFPSTTLTQPALYVSFLQKYIYHSNVFTHKHILLAFIYKSTCKGLESPAFHFLTIFKYYFQML